MRRRLILTTTALIAANSAVFAQDADLDLGTIQISSGQRDERALLDAPVAASVREGERLQSRQADTIQELTGDIPGVTIVGGPRGISQEINIRGFTDEQVVLRYDGGRFNFGQAHRGRFFVDPDLIQQVEVVRGGGSTLYGSGALGGVVSIETRDAADLLLPGQTQGGRVTLGYSSNGDILKGSGAVYADWGAWDALAYFGVRQMGEDLEDADGEEIPFSAIDQSNAMVKLGYEPNDDNRIEFSYSQFEDDGLTPANSSSDPGRSNPTVEREADVSNMRLSWDYAPADSDALDLSVLFYTNSLEITEDRVGRPRLDETRYDTMGLEATNRSRIDMGVPVDLVYGFEYLRDEQEGFRDGAPREAFPNAEATTFGAFAEATVGLSSQLDMIAGLRFDNYTRDPNDPTLKDVDENFFSPRIGLSYRPNENWQVFGNISQAFRAPSLSELYNDGLHFAGIPFVFPDNFFVPNPDLEPEESTQFEIGTRFDSGGVLRPGDRLSLSANLYYASVDNFIEQDVNIFAGTTTNSNIDSATLWGFEAEVDYDADTWFLGLGLTMPRGKNDEGGWLGSIPQDRLTLEGGVRPWQDWIFGARATLAADQDRVTEDGTPGESYQTLDLFASYAPVDGPLAGSVVRFGVDNLFNEDYTIYPNGLSQAGRTVKLSATFAF